LSDENPSDAGDASPPPADANKAPGKPPRDPLHGVTLAKILEQLVADLGWERMAKAVPIRCFTHEPSVTSSLRFLRKTPWARAKVEELYLRMLRRGEGRANPASDRWHEY
jgi:uncharacterized protein (DUF2132 family)